MASAASRCRYRSRPSKAVQRPSGPWTRLATTRWVCTSGSPSRLVRWSNPTASSPCPDTCSISAVATARPNVGVQIRGRLGHPGMMSGQHRPTGHRVAETVEDRDALGRAQDYVESRDSVAAVRAAEELPSRGVAALEHRLESGRRCFALQAEARWRRRHTRGLGTPRGQTGTARDRWRARECSTPRDPPRAWRCRPPPRRFPPASLASATHPWCIALLGTNFGSSVERTEKLHPL